VTTDFLEIVSPLLCVKVLSFRSAIKM